MEVIGGLKLPPAGRRLVADAMPFAYSGVETLVVPRLRWLRLPLRRQFWIAGHAVDLLIGDRLVLQIDGGHHIGRQRDSDNEHDARLRQVERADVGDLDDDEGRAPQSERLHGRRRQQTLLEGRMLEIDGAREACEPALTHLGVAVRGPGAGDPLDAGSMPGALSVVRGISGSSGCMSRAWSGRPR